MMKFYLKLLFQLTLSPHNGWEDIDKAMQASGANRLTPSRLATEGLFPLIAVTALTCFVQALYKHVEFLALFMNAIITFVVLFVSYFFGNFLMSIAIEPMLKDEYDEQRCQTLSIFTLGLLSLYGLSSTACRSTPSCCSSCHAT